MDNHQHLSDRRSFLRHFLFMLSGLGALMAAWGVGRFALFTNSDKRRREVPAEVLKSLQPDVPVHVPEAGAWLVKTGGTDAIVALDDRCTHLGCRQKWNPEKLTFECPCHGSEFDLQGLVKRGPASRPLPKLTVSQDRDDKLLLLERPS